MYVTVPWAKAHGKELASLCDCENVGRPNYILARGGWNQTCAAKGTGQLRSVLATDKDLGLNPINPSQQADF